MIVSIGATVNTNVVYMIGESVQCQLEGIVANISALASPRVPYRQARGTERFLQSRRLSRKLLRAVEFMSSIAVPISISI